METLPNLPLKRNTHVGADPSQKPFDDWLFDDWLLKMGNGELLGKELPDNIEIPTSMLFNSMTPQNKEHIPNAVRAYHLSRYECHT